jgi:preprotein translocase subunit Sss1
MSGKSYPQKENLKVKMQNAKWIILVLLIIVLVGYLIYCEMDFLNKNAGAI